MAPRGSTVGLAAVAVALGVGAALGPSALPSWNEPLPQYAARLLDAGATLTQDAYFRLLMALPGAVQATVSQAGAGGSDQAILGRASADAKDGLDAHKGLEQPVAKTSQQIDAQQQTSVKRYVEVQKEAAAGGKEPLVLPEQPDEVRERMPSVDPNGPEMRCGEAIGPESSVTTRGIEVRVKSSFQGSHGKQYAWKYTVSFKNTGQETVQMLTRHWVFVTSEGVLETEMKGPGARGVTPVLPPGGSWSYESGTTLSTPHGSMHGSFQFEVLKGDRSSTMRSFSGRVGRLLLSKKTARKKVPCVDPASKDLLPLTSVLATERVILGGHAEATGGGKKGGYKFAYDVQFNNARDAEIEVVGHSWTVVASDGSRKVVASGPGVGGVFGEKSYRLPAGDAFRAQGELRSKTPDANAEGTYRVIIKADDGTFQEIEARTDYMGISTSKTHVPDYVAASSTLR